MNQPKLDAIILAGGIPEPNSPLYPYSLGRPKALIDINGRPMLDHIIHALQSTSSIDDVLIVGLDNPQDQQQLSPLRPIHFLPSQPDMVANGMSALDWLRQHKPQTETVVGCSADIPHIKGHMVDELIESCRPFSHLLYAIYATPAQVDKRYPAAKRTYSTFYGHQQIASGDIFILKTAFRDTNQQLWENIVQARKKPWRVAQAVGLRPLIKYLTRRLTLQEAAEIGGRLLNGDPQSVKIFQTPYVELVMDGDKPHQIDILRQTAHSSKIDSSSNVTPPTTPHNATPSPKSPKP